jgi:tetratricopeptide (TPR) repeat protein
MSKKILSLFLVLLLCSSAWADSTHYSVAELRGQYVKASKEEAAAKLFHKKMSAYKEDDPVLLAYKAASEAVMAKHVWNPYSKLKQLKTANAIFEDAVALDKDNPEIRFLRFTVEHYVPRYLNLSAHVEEDKKMIIESLKAYPDSELPEPLARSMRDFMLTKDHCSEEEKKILRDISI